MRLFSGALVVICLTFGCCQALMASPAQPLAIKYAAAINSETKGAVYTYRRTKHCEVLPPLPLWDAKLAKHVSQYTGLLSYASAEVNDRKSTPR